jgi:hypothetical protein
MKQSFNKTLAACILTVTGSLLLALGAPLTPVNRFAIGIAQILCGFGLYFFAVYFVCDRNWMDIRAVFTGVWLCTIGLAALRLTDYQEQWQTKTWILVSVAYAAFQLGSNLGIHLGSRLYDFGARILRTVKIGSVKLKLNESRLFWCCVITTLVGLVCFLINAAIKGYIPCFSDDTSAYVTFYTKFHVFAVASTAAGGLCYYTLVTQKLPAIRKIILVLCMAYLVVLFPILVLSRGTFVVAALSLTIAIFYLHKRKLIVLTLCLASILGVYILMSDMRGYSDKELDNFFEPSDIVIVAPPDTAPPDVGTEDPVPPTDEVTFSLSPKAAFIYTYLTVSHDNFNEAVQNATVFAHGTKQLTPFNVILRSDWINAHNGSVPIYLVREHLNTTNLIGDFYYDFAGCGVGLCMLFWALIFGIMQSFCTHGKGPFALLTLGYAMTPVAYCFFSTWLSTFSQWLFWGVTLLLAIAACITVSPAEKM